MTFQVAFHGEGDQESGLESGDIVIVSDQKHHSVFIQQGHTAGLQKPLSALYNQTIVITSLPGQIYHRPYEKGHLIIEFKVNFPENGFLFPGKVSFVWKSPT